MQPMIIHHVEEGATAQRAFQPGNVFGSNLYFCEGEAEEVEFGLSSDGSWKGEGNRAYNSLAV